MKILIIEDDQDVVEVVRLCFELRWRHCETVAVTLGADGVESVEQESPDVVILDLGLPDMDGLDVCRRVRAFSDVPIVMLTVRDSESDKVKGLEAGADAYLTKPFSHIELLARVQAVLRRSQTAPGENGKALVSEGFCLDFERHEVTLGDRLVRLTPTECNLLWHMARSTGQVVPYRVLLDRVWGREDVNASDTLKVYVQRLRQKLADNGHSQVMITNERGIGYKLIRLQSG